jgi:hypothetical protein
MNNRPIGEISPNLVTLQKFKPAGVKLLKILFCYEKKFEPRFVVLDK